MGELDYVVLAGGLSSEREISLSGEQVRERAADRHR